MKKNKLIRLTLAFIPFLAIGTISAVNHSKNIEEVSAAVDINDYTSCDAAHNANQPATLLSRLRTITAPGQAGTYNDLWNTYKKAYVKDGYIFDYYSSITHYVPGGSAQGANYNSEGDSYNREHSIPKSWWGGSESNQGADPYIVVPTDGYVNNGRSNYTFGMVKTATHTYSNSKLGSGDSAYGYAGTVFEPDDSVKGDFARIYFYAIAKYEGSYNWKSGDGAKNFSGNANTNYGLTDYAVKLFSYWSNLDPVDDWEMSVNNKVSAIQGNRNPFVDHPEYANTLWGSNSGYTTYSHVDTGELTISNTSETLEVDETVQVSATSSNSSTISWSTGNSGIASISANSSASGANITITAVGEGSTSITATATVGGKQYQKHCYVTVVASGSGGDSSESVNAPYTLNTATTTIATSNTYAAYSESDTGLDWAVTLGSQQSGQVLWLGSNSTQKAKMTLSNGSYSEASSIATAINVSTSSTYYAALFQKSTGKPINNVKSVTLTYDSTAGTAPSEAWIVYSTNGGTTWNVMQKVTSVSPSGTTFTAASTIESALYGFVIHSTGYCQFKVPVLTFNAGVQLDGISLDTTNVKTTFNQNETFTYAGLVVTALYTDGTSETVTPTSVSSPDMSTTGNKTVTVTYQGESETYDIEVITPRVLTSITISGYTTQFVEGDTFVYGGTVTSNYSGGSHDSVTQYATFSGYDMTTVGEQTVTVSYTENNITKSKTYTITVSAGTLSSIAVSSQTTSYNKNATFSFDGTCTATFANGYQKVVTPTSVSSPNMTTGGNKTVTVSYTYNNVTKSTSYTISVNSTRVVIEETTISGTFVFSGQTQNGKLFEADTLAATYDDSNGLEEPSISGITALYNGNSSGGLLQRTGIARIGKSGSVTLTFNSTTKITAVKMGLLSWLTGEHATISVTNCTSYTSVAAQSGGDYVFTDHTFTLSTPVNEITISSNANRAFIDEITVYSTKETNIGNTSDCVGLETFIDTYMHMDYTQNLGYCNDNTHHYYSSAKTAFNNLNAHQRNLFTSNSAYANEWARLQTWASFNSDSLNSNNILAANQNVTTITTNVSSGAVIIATITLISIGCLSIFLYSRKRKEN